MSKANIRSLTWYFFCVPGDDNINNGQHRDKVLSSVEISRLSGRLLADRLAYQLTALIFTPTFVFENPDFAIDSFIDLVAIVVRSGMIAQCS